jgi:hypothetical protein
MDVLLESFLAVGVVIFGCITPFSLLLTWLIGGAISLSGISSTLSLVFICYLFSSFLACLFIKIVER